jgi:putative ATP-dependent endonuclease of the OLD family
MSEVRIKSIKIKNYRSFWNEEQIIEFPNRDYKKPVAIVWYNNAWKSNLMNAILYWLWERYVWEKEFNKQDLFNLNYSNQISIVSDLYGSVYWRNNWYDQTISWTYTINTLLTDNELQSKSTSFFWKNKHYQIFFVNFHQIKDQISTQKTSWGNIRSFLWKHINKLIEEDDILNGRKDIFKADIEAATKKVIEWWITDDKSKLFQFIENIKANYEINLRNSACVVDFWLPDYEDIFLQMLFKIWLNWNKDNLVPISNFGDWFISMFVMSVIQAISEQVNYYKVQSGDTFEIISQKLFVNLEELKNLNSNILSERIILPADKCLFLFEEPESFLHENHQEYFYKTVLCWLAEKGHQVIYTTHSDKMIDIFDTKWLIRLENDDTNWTIVKYNDITEFSPILDIPSDSSEDIIVEATNEIYNQYIKNIEPNLNKILFSKKVILVEWPNDLMCYKYAIEKRIEALESTNDTIIDKKKYAETFLNFHNIVIIPHHWKATALLLVELCKWIKVDYFVINDWDFQTDFFDKIDLTFEEIKSDTIWTDIENEIHNWEKRKEKTIKSMITVNKNLISQSWKTNIHFNISKLEKVIDYESDDKDAVKIWKHINSLSSFSEAFFPKKLEDFLLDKKIVAQPILIQNTEEIRIEDIPF